MVHRFYCSGLPSPSKEMDDVGLVTDSLSSTILAVNISLPHYTLRHTNTHTHKILTDRNLEAIILCQLNSELHFFTSERSGMLKHTLAFPGVWVFFLGFHIFLCASCEMVCGDCRKQRPSLTPLPSPTPSSSSQSYIIQEKSAFGQNAVESKVRFFFFLLDMSMFQVCMKVLSKQQLLNGGSWKSLRKLAVDSD